MFLLLHYFLEAFRLHAGFDSLISGDFAQGYSGFFRKLFLSNSKIFSSLNNTLRNIGIKVKADNRLKGVYNLQHDGTSLASSLSM